MATQKTLFDKKKRTKSVPLKAKQRTRIVPARPKNRTIVAIDSDLPIRKASGMYHHTLSSGRGMLCLGSLSLRSDVQMSWAWQKAPERLRRLKMQYPGNPEYVTVVPMEMKDSHFPPTAIEVFELADGYVVLE